MDSHRGLLAHRVQQADDVRACADIIMRAIAPIALGLREAAVVRQGGSVKADVNGVGIEYLQAGRWQ